MTEKDLKLPEVGRGGGVDVRSSRAVENDRQLECTLGTLKAVHRAFYSADDGRKRDVASCLTKVRSKVLKGVYMVFSGVIPVSGAPEDPRTHRLWKLAESHGAVVRSDIERHTTHVVAVRLGTAKTKTGLRMPGVFVVHVDWLLNSVWHSRREDETMFLLAGHICRGSPPAPPCTATPSFQDKKNIASPTATGISLHDSSRSVPRDHSARLGSAKDKNAGVGSSSSSEQTHWRRKRLRDYESDLSLRERAKRRPISAAATSGVGGVSYDSVSSGDSDSSESCLDGLIDDLES